MQVPILNWMDVHQLSTILWFKFLTMTAMKNLDFLKSFNHCSILWLTWTFPSSKTVLYDPQFTRQYLIEKAFIYCHCGNSSIPYVKPFV